MFYLLQVYFMIKTEPSSSRIVYKLTVYIKA